MRMWMLSPAKLCRQHLLGEHFEIHKAVGNLNHKGTWAKSLTEKGFLEPQNFSIRHNELVAEMIRRGYKHKSPLDADQWKHLKGKVNRTRAIRDLKARCKNCFN